MSYEKLSTPIVVDFPMEWFDMNQEDHFWFLWRQQVLHQLLAENSIPTQSPLTALEIGCGIGFLRRKIEGMTSWTVDGADVDEKALEKTIPGRGRTLLYRIDERQNSFKDRYDVLILFDVIEHIENDAEFLRTACWHLKNNGYVIINVPALPFLYSQYDRLVGHYRRYNRRMIQDLTKKLAPELEIIDVRYWGMSLVPITGLRKLLIKGATTSQEAIEKGFAPPFGWINSLINGVMRTETAFVKHPFIGSSVMALLRKRNPSSQGQNQQLVDKTTEPSKQ